MEAGWRGGGGQGGGNNNGCNDIVTIILVIGRGGIYVTGYAAAVQGWIL